MVLFYNKKERNFIHLSIVHHLGYIFCKNKGTLHDVRKLE